MERTLSPEEKIRRAEEIYARRKSGYKNRNIATVNVSEEKNFGLLKKMILQICISLLIYFIFYLIQNSNYIFSENVINKTKEILSYDIDIQGMYTQIINEINNWSDSIVIDEQTNEIDSYNTINNNINEEEPVENAIGGAEPENIIIEEQLYAELQQNTQEIEEQDKQSNQEEITLTDDEYIKTNFSFIKPINGIVSSEFGQRDVDNPMVSKNHTGIDIAANTGTNIIAAMSGTVTVSSTIGDYGYHIEIQNQDVKTLYAHCSKLLVNCGDTVEQGQIIAQVGSTGKSTGPHLHFEIKRGDTYINPRNILEF